MVCNPSRGPHASKRRLHAKGIRLRMILYHQYSQMFPSLFYVLCIQYFIYTICSLQFDLAAFALRHVYSNLDVYLCFSKIITAFVWICSPYSLIGWNLVITICDTRGGDDQKAGCLNSVSL